MPGGGTASAWSQGRSISSDFARFQSVCPLHRVYQPRWEVEWVYYQAGPTSDGDPLVFFHGTSGTAGAFFYQVQALAEKGYRVLSVQYPAFNSPQDWCKGFDLFLDVLKCRHVHIFGAGLGGFLAQHLAGSHPHRVKSLILCNSFGSTASFAERAGTLASVVCIMPTPLLRQAMLDAFPQAGMELVAKQAVDWVAQQVHDLNGNDLASRLSLNCTPRAVCPGSLPENRVTIMESNGETMVPEELRRQLRSMYPDAKVAQLKASGDFPYLSRPDEVTLFIEVHMRGVGVFRNCGRGAEEAATAAPATAGGAERLVAGDRKKPAAAAEWPWGLTDSAQPAAGTAAAVQWAEAEEPPRPRRPVWKNPFEDDPLL